MCENITLCSVYNKKRKGNKGEETGEHYFLRSVVLNGEAWVLRALALCVRAVLGRVHSASM